MFNATMLSIAEKIAAYDDWRISYEQARTLIPGNTEAVFDMMSFANKIRQWFKQNHVFKCSIVNAKSGRCAEDCAFCAQSAHHRCNVEIYPLLSAEQLIETGLRFADEGATHFSVVTSGTALDAGEVDTVCRVSEYLRNNSNLRLCASLGMLSEPSARKLKSAGIVRYHHNLETARSFFDQICTTHNFEDDIRTIQNAKSAGLEVCSGGILGMGESWEQRVELALTLRELDVDSVPINFLNPIPGTQLEAATPLSPMDALASIALFRFIHPRKDITICGGRELTLKDFQSWIFLAGANGIMVGNYLTTQGRDIQMDHDMIAQMGFLD